MQSIEFISPHVALGRGSAVVSGGEDDPNQTQFSAVYVKQSGAWLIDRVTEEQTVLESSHFEQLQRLDWMIGQWVDAGDEFTIEMTCDWTTKQNYICRKFSVTDHEEISLSGLQIIGWDPQLKTIRSWLFDSEGAFISGVWTERDDQWVVQSVASLADGTSGSFTSIFKPLDNGNYTWQKINQVVDGELRPNVDEIVVQKK